MRPQLSSITASLALSLAGVTAVTFLAAGIAIYWGVAYTLEQTAREEMTGKLRIVQHFVDEVVQDGNLETLRHHIDDVMTGHGELTVWLLNDRDEVVHGGFGLPVRQLRESDFAVQTVSGKKMAFTRTSLENTGSLQLRTVVIALDMAPRDRLLRALLYLMLTAGSLAMLLTFTLSLQATRYGLRPIGRLSRQAATIAPSSLALRLNISGTSRELEELAQAFNGVLDRLESAYQQMSSFNADVAHELRTPLATLISGTQLALSANRPLTHLRATLESNLEELEGLKSLVNDMMFLAHADHGTVVQDLVDTNLRLEVQKVCEFYDALLEDSGLKAVIEGRATARCSPALMRRAISNLLSNAIKFTAPGESIKLSLTEHDRIAEIAVANPGPPIPTETQERMFSRFYQADPARVRSGDSHGLGLAIVSAIAMMHGGRAFCESADGMTRVGIRIPQ
ncbi:heavy metal sensor histidine kinase [Polaromonas sp.]|uniref:heavy metal sensor histidine kinase n=1 Tax=Polaromonas sp. TaxID=1869339 RepID=UPI002730275C|nr:heavy metal sensor histidine kinase [Polaromonas sp.]MDP2450097.1 heavy metal sensor histidine kinase [Polaromonas sp.]